MGKNMTYFLTEYVFLEHTYHRFLPHYSVHDNMPHAKVLSNYM